MKELKIKAWLKKEKKMVAIIGIDFNYEYIRYTEDDNLFNENLISEEFFEYGANKTPILSIKGRRTTSAYFKDVLKSGMKVKEKVFSIEDIIKSEIKKIKKELIDYENDYDLELKRDTEITKEKVKEVAEDELFTFVWYLKW